MTAQPMKILPHPLHDWQDEQRRKDEPENLLHELRDILDRLKGFGMVDEANEIYADWYWGKK